MDFTSELKMLQKQIETRLSEKAEELLTSANLQEGMKYSLLAGGKRVRPVLACCIVKACGGDVEDVLNISIALECIHTYSLIHDDLPAMDNDDLRRGKPTNHKVFGEAMAILAGDGLLNYAFEIIFDEIIKRDYSPCYIEAGSLVAKAAGPWGMIGGQVIDIEKEGLNITIEELYEMHSKKTGALIEAACLLGVVISKNKNKQLLETVKEYSQLIGLTFQIVDDILDYTGNELLLGKKIGSDKENNKSTFISLLGLERSKSMADELTKKAILLADIIDGSGFLTEYTKYLLTRQN
jgi:geranylgeranyl diphosphate synthase type II